MVAEFVRHLAVGPGAIRERISLNDLSGAASQAVTLEKAAAVIGALQLEESLARLRHALAPGSAARATLLHAAMIGLDQAIATTLQALVTHARQGGQAGAC